MAKQSRRNQQIYGDFCGFVLLLWLFTAMAALLLWLFYCSGGFTAMGK